MRVLQRLMIAGAALALLSAPAFAHQTSKLDAFQVEPATAQQQTCQGWGVRCDGEVTPSFCIADDKCASALPGGAIARYDQRMDSVLRG
jgi:invasion protein IalB